MEDRTKGLSSVAANNLKGIMAGVTAMLLIATGIFLYESRGESYPHVTIIASYALLGLSVVSIIILIVFSIYDSRVDRIIELIGEERDKTVGHYKGLINTLEVSLDASNSRDVERMKVQSQTYSSTINNDIAGWKPVSSDSSGSMTSES